MITELKQTMTMTATRTSPNKMFNEEKNSCARYKSVTLLCHPLQNNKVR